MVHHADSKESKYAEQTISVDFGYHLQGLKGFNSKVNDHAIILIKGKNDPDTICNDTN